MIEAALVGLYLAAIVTANLIISHFGPSASLYTAAGAIGLNLTVRDKLHDLWGANRFRNMALLIAAGSVVSYVAAKSIGAGPPEVVARIALASCVAFAVAESVDAIVYHRVRHLSWFERVSRSNALSAVLDSIVFVSIAFGWDTQLIVAQAGVKFLGGYAWAWALSRVRERRVAYA